MTFREITRGWYLYTDQIPHLILALLVLLIGWLLAKGMGKAAATALTKTHLDNKLFSNFGNRKYSTESIIGRVVYYALLVVVWIIFFNMLNLHLIAEPLVTMVSTMTAAIPHLLKAVLILLLSWGIAYVIRQLIKKGASMVHLEQQLVKWKLADNDIEAANKVSSIAKAFFYLVLLFFLPAVLGALELRGISEPFANVLTAILAFIPKFFAAALILLIGWLVAKLVRDIVVNFLKSIGTDKLGQRLELFRTGEKSSVSSLIGNIVFILILVPTVIAALEKLDLKGISDPAVSMLEQVLGLIPNILVAVILVLAGIWLGKWVEKWVSQMLWRLRFDYVFTGMGLGTLTPEKSKYTLSQLVGVLAKVVVVLLFTSEALQIVHLDFLVTLLTGVIAYLPMLFAAVMILGIGLYLGQLVECVLQSVVKQSYSRILSKVSKYAVIVITAFMALDQLGVAHSIVNAAFILVLGGVALAFGLAFGLGGTDFAGKYLRKLDHKLDRENSGL
ncbi:mechanosensitive ion channel [Neobacillus dielmonensis]|uniref:mechanosensitive ion channel n=1 Tax=Neobacillus dielmonensis TaxID=1347369 RepID=UPI0005A6AD26|nr:mechanosensitive ion channel [Neobacillus dielmonensis]